MAEQPATDDSATTTDDADVFEIEVELKQTALVSVKADSRKEAWEAVREPQDREVSEVLRRKDFTGDFIEPLDLIATNATDEIDIDLTEG